MASMASTESSVNFATIQDPRKQQQQQKQENPIFRFICNANAVNNIEEHYEKELKKMRNSIYRIEESNQDGNENPEKQLTLKQIKGNIQYIDNIIKKDTKEIGGLVRKCDRFIQEKQPNEKTGRVSPTIKGMHMRHNVPTENELKKISEILKDYYGKFRADYLLVKLGKTDDPDERRKLLQKMHPALQRVKKEKFHKGRGGRKKKTRKKSTKKMNLSAGDYRKILKFYKLSIPKKVSNLRKKGDKIIAKKFCSCIKKVRAKFKKEGIAIAICTKSVITRKGIKRGKFKCKKRRSIKLFRGGRKRSTKKNIRTRKKRGGAPRARSVRRHVLTVKASNDMLKYFRNPETQEILYEALQLCGSKTIKDCLSRELNTAGVQRTDYGNLSDEDKTKYHRVIEICRPNAIQIPWNTQSGE